MRRTTTYAAALALAVTAVGPATARPEPLPVGGGCGFTTAPDPTDPSGWTAVVHSAPVVLVDAPLGVPDPTAYPASLTVVCSIEIHPYSGAYRRILVASGSGTGAAAVAPTAVSFRQEGEFTAYACTTVHVTDAQGRENTYHRNYQNGMYETEPYGACGGAYCESTGPECSYWSALEQWLYDGGSDEAVCATLLRRLPPGDGTVLRVEPDGDTHVAIVWVWDCPPYEP